METVTQARPIHAEAAQWVDQLRGYINELNQYRDQFYQWAAGKTDPEVRKQIEHFHNQFHIQLVNLYDLKHEIRRHIKGAETDSLIDPMTEHRLLYDKLESLINGLETLKAEYRQITGA